MLHFSRSHDAVVHQGRLFDPWALQWESHAAGAMSDCEPVSPLEAMVWMYRQDKVRRVPVAVIGPKVASLRQTEVAEAVGRRLGQLGATMITGGKSGVMEAASRGHALAGGVPIGILPDEEWDAANQHVTIPIATGIGPARNAIIARAAFALIAIGGEHGTMSEMALGLHFDRLVIALEDAPEVPGVLRCGSIEDALDRVARRLFKLDS